MVKISKDKFQGFERITVENDQVSFSLLPQIGGKMISLIYKETGHEHISLSERPFRRPDYAGNFEDYDISGFDECFPTVVESFYPEAPWKGIQVPDHGELWTLPWNSEIKGEALELSVTGVRFPYRLVKTFSLTGNKVNIDYQLENLCSFGFKYIWSAHPLLKVNPGAKIVLPGNPEIRTDWSVNEKFGKLLYQTTWPNAETPDGEMIDLSIIKTPDTNHATKFITTALNEGWCALHDVSTRSYLKISFPVEKIPYLGVWINEGGWPLNGEPSYDVALEPCTGCPDKLATAIQRGEHARIDARTTQKWYLQLTLGKNETD